MHLTNLQDARAELGNPKVGPVRSGPVRSGPVRSGSKWAVMMVVVMVVMRCFGSSCVRACGRGIV